MSKATLFKDIDHCTGSLVHAEELLSEACNYLKWMRELDGNGNFIPEIGELREKAYKALGLIEEINKLVHEISQRRPISEFEKFYNKKLKEKQRQVM